MMQWNTIVIAVCLAALAWLLWQELRRPVKARLAIRIAATVLAVASLAGLALPLQVKIHTTQNSEAILLTEGYREDSLQLFVKNKGKNLPVYQQAQLNSLPANIAVLHVFGYGLSQSECTRLPAARLILHASPPADGISEVHWQPQLTAGKTLLVQGSVNHASAKPLKLLLSGQHTILDSVTLPAAQQHFELSAVPKHLGRAVYSLAVIIGKDTIEQQPVALQVSDSSRLHVLVLAAWPDFENKFLREWLAAHGYAVSVRTIISKDKYGETFLNTSQRSLTPLKEAMLDSVDVIIADAQALQSAGESELAAIRTQVAEKGMGLIVRADTTIATTAFYNAPFALTVSADHLPKKLQLVAEAAQPAAALPFEQTVYINGSAGTQALVRDAQQHVLAGSSLYGSGRVVLSTIGNTYSWLLGGNKKEYQSFWTLLLQQAARKKTAVEQWQTIPALPQVNEPVQLVVNAAYQPQVQVGQSPVHLAQDAWLPHVWKGRYWPDRAGWQPGITTNGQTYWWYAYAPNDWINVQRQQRVSETLQYSRDAQTRGRKVLSEEAGIARKPLSKWYAAALFLLGCAVLWIEKKLTYA